MEWGLQLGMGCIGFLIPLLLAFLLPLKDPPREPIWKSNPFHPPGWAWGLLLGAAVLFHLQRISDHLHGFPPL